ncbi:DUF4157 domain-containing protein [Actinokineospora sp. NBRC 105648]|uniref:eCIS core domain-containing protein n=1 Tax=Actinokineospora sp. NBRC 105648 TaxID=3032206 RepID=UPI002555F8EB|nr:DUF4157 domain-containing protein [Actinokineospora sp. NBRC 105648]
MPEWVTQQQPAEPAPPPAPMPARGFQRPSVGQTRKLGLGAPIPPDAVPPGRPPPDLVDAMRARHNIDVADVPVHRGPRVAEEARVRGARAFAAGGAVYLPDNAAPGLLAHELVHAIQQRKFGASLPAEDTPAGRALEAEAVAAEQHHPHADVRTAQSTVDIQGPVQRAPLAPENSKFEPAEREEVSRIAEHEARVVVEEWTNPVLARQREEQPRQDRDERRRELQAEALDEVREESAAGDAGPTELTDVQQERIERRLDYEEQTRTRQVRSHYAIAAGYTRAEQARAEHTAAQTRAEDSGKDDRDVFAKIGITTADFKESLDPDTWFEPTGPDQMHADADTRAHGRRGGGEIDLDRIDLDELSTRLYDRLRSRLRLELLIDRERAGLLTDFR